MKQNVTNENGARCSEELKELIYFENLLDPNFDFKDLFPATEKSATEKKAGFRKDFVADPEVEKRIEAAIAELPEKLRQLVSNGSLSSIYYRILAENITELRETAHKITARLNIVERAKEKSAEEKEFDHWMNVWLSKQTTPRHEMFRNALAVTVSGGSVMYWDEYILGLKSEYLKNVLVRIDPHRLRRCFVCGRVFWAERLDKYGCSEQHSATLRKRRQREKEKDAAALKERKRREWQNQDFSKKDD